MKKNYVFYTGLVLLACLFLFSNIAFAQDTATSTDAVSEEESAPAEPEELPADVALDEKVTTEDLGAVDANVLPGSALHIFKRFGWTMQEIFETDPVADAELKIKHANQELAELKQLIDEEGFGNVSPGTINSVMARFEGRLENVNNVAEALRDLKESDPQAVDELLNNLTDKQFKYQKVLESIERDVIKEKEENPDASSRIEDVFVRVTETKDKALEHFGETLGTVDEKNPEKIAERIIKITDKQEGSEFKHLKNLEVLKRLEKQVPTSAKGAIALAQENTLKFFNRDISALPEAARAERFEQYNRFNYGDETRQLSFLDDLKLLEDVPPEILKKIEEVKEFAISKFEKKMSKFDQPGVLDSYMKHLSGENFDDMVLAEQLASRALFEDNPEIKQRMDDIKNESVKEFTNRFTDPDSQAQIAKFQELEKILEERPGDPKVMKMMQELETQVRNDPAKAEFLDQMDQLEDKMRFEFEAKFADEGDKYFDRIGTLDPRDFEVYKQFSGENFLPEELANKFLDHGVGQYRDYMQDVNSPEQFDRFNSKFNGVPQFVIDEIKNRDSEFGDAMQFKRQAMEKLRFEEERQLEIDRQVIDYKEKELSHQLDRARRQADEEFWRKVDSIPYENFDERKALFEEKRKTDLARLDEEHKARLEIFNKRLELDPWCDSACKQIQKQFIDQEFRHQRERIQDDYVSSQKRIEFDLARAKQDNPLFGVCDTPESCYSYCQVNPNVEACKTYFHEPIFHDDEPKDYDCGPGKYFDFEQNECRADPYYKPPTNFTQCKLGSHWNEIKGFCEPDFKQPIINPVVNKPDCGPDSYFDFRENRCISYRIEQKCPVGSYLGPTGKCIQKDFQCPDISAAYPAPCPAGQNRGIITNNNGCRVFSECRESGLPIACPVFDYLPCPDGEYREEYRDENGCLMPGKCVSIDDTPVTCTAYFEGYEYNSATDRCELRGTSGCNDPFKYKTLTECQEGNVTGTVPTYPTSSNWVNKTWYFSDGSTSSSILNRTDSEYTDYIASIEVQCKSISQSQFAWKPGAGDDSVSNWQNFGIPDCSGNAEPNTYPYPTETYGDCYNNKSSNSCYAQAGCNWFTNPDGYQYCEGDNFVPPSTYVGDSGCEDILDILPGCHLMSESPNVRFNSVMDQYVEVGTRTIQYCSSDLIPGCTSYYSNTYGYCGDNVCGSGEDTYNCSSDCGGSTSTYEGDENSCPGFAYSIWDQGGVRYCQLNNRTACDYNYPSYLTDDGSYTEANCPVYDNQYDNQTTTYPASTYVGDSGCEDILDILPGCHLMSESPNVRFNSVMDQYVEVGTRTIQYCSSDLIPGCTSYYSSGGNTGSSTYCPPPSYWDPAINACAPTTDTSSTPSCEGAGGFDCPSGYEYDSNGCVSGCLPDYTEPACPDSSSLTCDYGYEYDNSGCQTGCIPPPPAEEPPPSEPTYEEPPPEGEPPQEGEPPPAANVWEALKALFGF